MNPALLRRLLMWVAPLAIGYVVKKYEEKQARKKTGKSNGQRYGLETNNPTYKNEVGFFLSFFPETMIEKKPEN